ncbi:MAG TPA: hypothetical protein GX506_06250 [Firmicutes bacterium]|nr:hypothetical protein [Bacillota bacterium]
MGGSNVAAWQSVESPAWLRDAIIYEIFPRVFSKGGTFAEITARLPELKDLGVNCIWLMPIHKIGLDGRKGILGSPYSIYDYYSIDPSYGSPQDFRTLVDSAHGLGLRVIMDFVANHTSNDSVLTRLHPEWFCRDENGRIRRAGFGWDDVSQLNYHCNPGLEDYMTGVARHWIQDYDVDGFRCDVAALVPVEFWVKFRREIKGIKPDALLLAESHEPIHNQLAFDLTYEEWLPGVLEGVARGTQGADSIRGLLVQQEREFPPGSLRLRYLENHDQARAMARFGREPARAFALLLFTLDGVPLLYNGQEVGATERPSIFDPFTIDWEGTPDAHTTRDLYRSLAHLRAGFPALRRGGLSFIDATGDRVPGAVLAFIRDAQDIPGTRYEAGARDGAAAHGGPGFARSDAIVVLNLSGVAQNALISVNLGTKESRGTGAIPETGAGPGAGSGVAIPGNRVVEGAPVLREVFRVGGVAGACGGHPVKYGPHGLTVYLDPWSGVVFEVIKPCRGGPGVVE